MHILLNGCHAASNYRGWGRYSMELMAALAAIDDQNRYSVYYTLGDGHRERLEARLSVPNFGLRGFPAAGLRRSEDVPAELLRDAYPDVDVYHSMTEFPAALESPNTVITIHELTRMSAPRHRSPEERRTFEASVRQALDLANAVVVVSQNTRQELERCFPGLTVPVRTIWNGVSEVFSPEEAKGDVARLGELAGSPFLLFVGAVDDPDKNFSFLVDGLKRVELKAPWVVVTRDHDRQSLVEKFSISSSLAERLRVFENVSDAHLSALYRGCGLFVFPSFHEGFGLPVAEAMACGAPVLCARSSSLVEVGDGHCVMFDNDDLADFVRQLRQCLKAYPGQLLGPAAERARTRFRWEQCARKHLALYELVGS